MAGHWRKSETLEQRFMKYVAKSESTDCWLWTGNLDHYGYGRIGFKMKTYRASRAAMMIFAGVDPATKYVCHKCDNPKCVNPKHLFLGTQKDNMADCHKKKRTAGGERNGMAKLKREDIPKIKSLLKSGFTHKEIGERFGVSRSHIGSIANGIRWNSMA